MSRIGRSTLAVIAIAALALLVACQRQEPVALRQRTQIRMTGAGPTMALLKVLAAEYDDAAVEFVFLPGLHSAGGIEGVANGSLDVGAVARELTDEEKSLGLRHTALSNDAIIVAVHPGCGVRGLSTEQVRDIYAGRYTNWRQLGGNNVPIVVLDRNEDESAKIAFRKHVLGASLTITSSAGVLSLEPDMIEAVASTPGAIGYFSLSAATAQGTRVQVLDLDGVVPSVANVHAGRYRAVRPLGVVTRPDVRKEIIRFLEWATGPEGNAVMERHGYAAAR